MNDIAKTIAFLCAGLVVCFLALWGLSLGREKQRADSQFIPDWLPEDTETVKIETPQGSFSAARDAGGAWSLVEPFAAPADSAMLERMLHSLAAAVPSDALTYREMRRLGRNLAEFGLSPARISATFESERQQKRIFFGLPVPSGDAVYARAGDVDAVFAVPTNAVAAIPLSADAVRDRTLLRFDPAKVSGLDVRSPGAPFLRASLAEGAWRMEQPAPAPAAPEAVSEALARLASAKVHSFAVSAGASKKDGAPQPLRASVLAQYGLDDERGVKVSVRVGAHSSSIVFGAPADGATNLVYALVQDGSGIATVDASLPGLFAGGARTFRDTRIFARNADLSSVSFSADGKMWALARDANSRWRLTAPVEAPADDAAVSALLAALLRLRDDDRAGPAAQDGVRVAVKHAAQGVETQPFTVKISALGGTAALDSLRSRTVLALDESQIARITAVCGGATNTIVRNPSSQEWMMRKPDSAASPSARELDALRAFRGAIANVEAAAVEELSPSADDMRRFGLDTPFAVISIDMAAGGPVRKNLVLGARCGGGRYAASGAADAVFVLDAAAVSALVAPFLPEADRR